MEGAVLMVLPAGLIDPVLVAVVGPLASDNDKLDEVESRSRRRELPIRLTDPVLEGRIDGELPGEAVSSVKTPPIRGEGGALPVRWAGVVFPPAGGGGKGAEGGGVAGNGDEGPPMVERARRAGDIFSALARFNSGDETDRVMSESEALW